jgi:predicted nucleic acid-binding protein
MIAMAIRVVDASAIAAILFDEPRAETVATEIGDHTLAAPALLEYELGNVCWKKCRRHPHLADLFRTAFEKLREFDLQLHDVEAAGVLGLAMRSEITFYDASYLWLARTLAAPLITLDGQLAARSAR